MKICLRIALLIGFLAATVMVRPPTATNAADDAVATVERLKRQPGKFVEVILSEQRLDAWESGRIVMTTPVSTGVRRTPTPTGTFRITRKYVRQRMAGPGYDLPNVPYVMYFRSGGYAMHGTYWHNSFGRPMSHCCVNLPTGSAAWLYQWAPSGTTVVVRA